MGWSCCTREILTSASIWQQNLITPCTSWPSVWLSWKQLGLEAEFWSEMSLSRYQISVLLPLALIFQLPVFSLFSFCLTLSSERKANTAGGWWVLATGTLDTLFRHTPLLLSSTDHLALALDMLANNVLSKNLGTILVSCSYRLMCVKTLVLFYKYQYQIKWASWTKILTAGEQRYQKETWTHKQIKSNAEPS